MKRVEEISESGLRSALLVMLALLLLGGGLQAQHFYFRAGGGYAFETSGTAFNDTDPLEITMVESSTNITVNADGATTVESLQGTLGEGYRFNLTAGYMLNEYLGLEVGGTYFNGRRRNIGKFNSPIFQSQATAYIEGVDIMPAVFVTPGLDRFNPYARIGPLLTAAGDLTIETVVNQLGAGPGGSDIQIRALSEVQSEFSVGYSGALGVNYALTNNIRIFGEAKLINFTIKSESAEIQQFTTAAVSEGGAVLVEGGQLEDLPVRDKQFVFADEFTFDAEAEQPENEPTVLPRQRVNVSSIGFNFGVQLSLQDGENAQGRKEFY